MKKIILLVIAALGVNLGARGAVQDYSLGAGSEGPYCGERIIWVESQDSATRVHGAVPSIGICREVTDTASCVYAFDTRGDTKASIKFYVGNQFLFSASSDGVSFKEVLRFPKAVSSTGLANLGWYEADISKLLPADKVYIKVEDGDQKHAGYGALIFGVKVFSDNLKSDRMLLTAAKISSPPVIDGRLNELCWNEASSCYTFSERFGHKLPDQNTTVQACWDRKGVYLSFRCFDSDVKNLVAMNDERDSTVYADDCIELFFDPEHNGQSMVHLALNSIGAQFDESRWTDPMVLWNGKWIAKTAKWDNSWTAELFIPWSDLRIKEPQTGMMLGWNANREDGADMLTATPIDATWHEPQNYGHLVLVDALKPFVNLVDTAIVSGENKIPVRIENPSAEPQTTQLLLRIIDEKTKELVSQKYHQVLLAAKSGQSVDFPFTISNPGRYRITAALFQDNVLISSVAQLQSIDTRDFVLFDIISRQPYYRNEDCALFEVTVKTDARRTSKMDVEVTLNDSEGNSVANASAKPQCGKKLVIPIEIKKLPVGKYSASVVLRESSKIIQSNHFVIEKLVPYDKPACVATIDKWGNLHVNGRKKFARWFHLASPHSPLKVEEFGGNMAMSGGPHLLNQCRDSWYDIDARMLKVAQETKDVLCIPHICGMVRRGTDFESLRACVSYCKDNPQLIAWYLADEPGGWNTRVSDLEKARHMINQIDPNHPVIVLDNNPPSFGVWASTCDIFSSDPYPGTTFPLKMVSDWTKMSVRACKPNQPVWMCLQAAGKPWWQRYPTPIEFRNMFYQAIVHGSKGMVYWCLGPTINDGDKAILQQLARETDALTPYILSDTPYQAPKIIKQGAAEIHYLVKTVQSEQVIFAVNVTPKAASVEIPVLGATEVHYLYEKGNVDLSNGKIFQHFEPLSVHLYKVMR